jgi:hypothetical protein
MGTNYYLHEATCSHCGHGKEKLHIGKSSGGWCFSLHVDPDLGIRSLEDWIERWSQPGAYISDEYGDRIDPERMLEVIRDRSWHRPKPPDKEFLSRNHAAPGPKGLLRHAIDPRHCVSHGPGTWDHIIGEFC